MVAVSDRNLVITVSGDEETAGEFKKAMFAVLKSADPASLGDGILYWYLELLQGLD